MTDTATDRAPGRDLILLSGGLDSTTALALAHRDGRAGMALTVDYGQRHRKEVRAAKAVAEHYGVRWELLELLTWGSMLKGSALTDPTVPVPHGHYAAPSMSTTVVPNRNATLLMAAAGIAMANGCTAVVTAIHAGDHAIYPDCRPEFFRSARATMELGTDGAVTLHAPFVNVTKTQIAALAGELDVPIDLTWSCYEGGAYHCGRCGTCVERIEALADAGVLDPTEYLTDRPEVDA